MIVDDMYDNHTPELLKDIHWEEHVPAVLPYTEETVHYRKEEPMGGAEKKVNTYKNLSEYHNKYKLKTHSFAARLM